MKKCKYIKTNKEQCKANAIENDDYCFWHSEKAKDVRKVALQKGGESPKRNYENSPVTLKTTNDVLELLEKTVNELRQNKSSTRIANAIGYLSGIMLKAIEQNSFEKRLEVIEYALKIRKENN
jgi:hypothetical protein